MRFKAGRVWAEVLRSGGSSERYAFYMSGILSSLNDNVRGTHT